MSKAAVLTRDREDDRVVAALATLERVAARSGVEIEHVERRGHDERVEQVDTAEPRSDDVDICFALGGDGTILRALRRYGGTQVPVYGVNFGEIGFLATIEPDAIEQGFEAAFAGEFEVLALPAIAFSAGGRVFTAMNDLSIHRLPDRRIAELGVIVEGAEVGSVRCDGLVAATPVGSTGYNLANGGPLLAWGVEGYVVTFIAPHSLTARPLVIAPQDALELVNRSESAVDIAVDGRSSGELLAPGESISAHWISNAGHLAQLPGSSFYARAADRFGRLAS